MCSTSFSWGGTADQRTHCALETTLISLSSYFSFKLYLVGGSVRRGVDDGRRTPTGRQSPLEIWKTNLKSFILLTKQPSKTVLYHLNSWRCVILDPMIQWPNDGLGIRPWFVDSTSALWFNFDIISCLAVPDMWVLCCLYSRRVCGMACYDPAAGACAAQ